MPNGLLLDGQATTSVKQFDQWKKKITSQFSNTAFKDLLLNALNTPCNQLARQLLLERVMYIPHQTISNWLAVVDFSKLNGQACETVVMEIHCAYTTVDYLFDNKPMVRIYPKAEWYNRDHLYFSVTPCATEINAGTLDVMMDYYDEEHSSFLLDVNNSLVKINLTVDTCHLVTR